jgi:HSP20 family protein
MDRDFSRGWMWAEACETLARAERLHRQFFQLARTERQVPAWEPPVDVIETDREVLVLVALPGVDPDHVEATIGDDGTLHIAGTRVLPVQLQTAVIHRLELPQGRFARRIPLPFGRYSAVRRGMADGCMLITLEKAGVPRG